jgi:hypothetical protein
MVIIKTVKNTAVLLDNRTSCQIKAKSGIPLLSLFTHSFFFVYFYKFIHLAWQVSEEFRNATYRIEPFRNEKINNLNLKKLRKFFNLYIPKNRKALCQTFNVKQFLFTKTLFWLYLMH